MLSYIRKILGAFGHVFCLIIIVGAGLAAFWWFGGLRFYPTGYDVVGHLFRVIYLVNYFPHHNWIFVWAGGMHIWLWYPILIYYVTALIGLLGSFSFEISLTIAGVSFMILIFVAFYFLIYEIYQSRAISLLLTLILICTPAIWSWMLSAGTYGRFPGFPFFILTILMAIRFLKSLWQEQSNKMTLHSRQSGAVSFPSSRGLSFAEAKARLHSSKETGTTPEVEKIFSGKKVNFVFLILFWAGSFLGGTIIGALLLPILGLIFMIVAPRLWQGIKEFAKVLFCTALLSAWTLLTMAVIRMPGFRGGEGQVSFETMSKDLVSWWQFIGYKINPEGLSKLLHNLGDPFAFNLLTLNPFIFSLLALSLLILLILCFRKIKWRNIEIRFIVAFLFLTILNIIFAHFYINTLITKIAYAGFILPSWSLFFIPIFVLPAVAFAWKIIFNQEQFWLRLSAKIISLEIIILLIAYIFIAYPPQIEDYTFPRLIRLNQSRQGLHDVFEKYIPPNQFNLRVDTHDAGVASWFNNAYPLVPQPQDYFYHGALNRDYRVWLLLAAWRWPDNYNETSFLFDWYADKQLIVNKNNLPEDTKVNAFDKLSQRSDLFTHQGAASAYDIFTFNNSTPILSTTNAPNFLVISKQKGISYSTVLRALSYANLNSQYLIPIQGEKEYIDDYKLEELKQFKMIILYEYKIHNQKKAEKLLKDYVNQGGGLFVEANKEDWENRDLLEVFPVSGAATVNFPKEWQLKTGDGGQDIVDIKLAQFSSPIFGEDQSWKMVEATEVKSWAKTVLSNYGKPIVVRGKFGQGKVIWSGMNLPYHIITYHNEEESRFFGKLLYSSVGLKLEEDKPIEKAEEKDLTYETDSYKTEFVNPEKRIVTLKKSTDGALFKESYFRNWHAKLIKGNDVQKLKIYYAGPGFMYVRLPEGVKAQDKIIFEYKKSWWPEKISIIISLLTLLGLLLYAFGGKFINSFLNKIRSRINEPIKKTSQMSKSWWEDDDY